MKKSVEVRGIRIGDGIPKICVPIFGKTSDELLKSAKDISGVKHQMVEWRVDWFEKEQDLSAMVILLSQLRSIIGDFPLLFTFRTKSEGGESDISKEEYLQLNLNAVSTGLIDLIDVELFTGEDLVKQVIEAAHEAGVKVVLSSHDFEKTPSKKEIINRLQRMQSLGADIAKLAVMPADKADVITLLSATEEMNSSYATIPIVTMSMGTTGVISRICGEFSGSAITFGTCQEASAPGQIPANELSTLLNKLHKCFNK